MLNFMLIDKLIKDALAEDIGTGDITTNATVDEKNTVTGRFIAKESGILCGLDVCKRVFFLVDEEIKFAPCADMSDGKEIKKGDIIAAISGKARSVLNAERVSLNLLQHMSGIATQTHESVKSVSGTNAKISDTRKTTPCMRVVEKYAVKTGGGVNHRFNLSDGILIKDNHIAANGGSAGGGIKKAVEAARKNAPHTLKIEVECENIDEVAQALEAEADIIMLDNMTNEDMKKAVEFISGRAITEASGNMGEKDLRLVAETGVDIISIGALTHSVKNLDISLKFMI
jgi:nicotinate-nucleotide pyrophosphorylase (carboxylating)